MKFTLRGWALLFSVVVATNVSAVETAKPAATASMAEKVQGLAVLLKSTGLTMAKGEATVRANPAALTDQVATKIFSLGQK